MFEYYCLLHSKTIPKWKAKEKCRCNKPSLVGLPYQMTRKSQKDYKCKHLIRLEKKKDEDFI